MKIRVEKFGGSSLATPDHIMAVAQGIVGSRVPGEGTVVVVSAMGRTTTELLALARQVANRPPARELALLLATGETVAAALLGMSLQALGQPAVALTGAQAGLCAFGHPEHACIAGVQPGRVVSHLRNGEIVVVAGYQARLSDDICVLGRGGSDITAVALAVALRARWCRLFSDVSGVYSADPALVPEAILRRRVGYEEMSALATAGARVIMPRAVELARRFGLEIQCGLSATRRVGTRVTRRTHAMENRVITGFAIREQLALARFQLPAPELPALSEQLAARGAEAAQIFSCESTCDNLLAVSLLVSDRLVSPLLDALRQFGDQLHFTFETGLCQLSAVGFGLSGDLIVFHEMLACLRQIDLSIVGARVSESAICFLLPGVAGRTALQRLHEVFIQQSPKRSSRAEGGRPEAADVEA